MALSKNDEQLLDLLLKERTMSGGKRSKPLYIKLLQFSTVILSLVLFITVGAGGILLLTKPGSATAANTYTETWTANNAVYSSLTGGTIAFHNGFPADGTAAGASSGANGTITVTGWSVSGTIN
ncbi:MAG TPA: hypothetical protein VLF93_00690 [Candidatus Saccharimonadales bacterium]|nr:hypothetical protein [Candidatus Saccharimonadales bacterium]